MKFALALLGVVVLAYVGLVVLGMAEIKKRNLLLVDNNYFVGRSIEEVIAALGTYSAKHLRWPGNTGYVWSSGNAAVLFICDKDNQVVDYCPPRQTPEFASDFFEKKKEVLIGQTVWAIKKHLGESHRDGSFDFGTACDIWNVSGRKTVEVWSKNGVCTEIVFNT